MIRALAAALLLAVPQSGTAQTPTPVVVGQSFSLASASFGTARTVNVWLPRSYAQGQKRYPVLYLIDGGADQDFAAITGLVDWMAGAGLMSEVIVVGVATQDRQNELAPPSTQAKTRADYPTAGNNARFRRLVANEVKPWVAAHYRTGGGDGVIGESLAGLFIVDTLLRQPDLFDRYVAISPSLWWDDMALDAAAPALLARLNARPLRLWLSVANERGMGVDRFAAALARAPASLRWTFVARPGETHGSTYLPAAMVALPTMFPPPPPAR